MLASRVYGAFVVKCRSITSAWHAYSEASAKIRTPPVLCHSVTLSRTLGTSVNYLNPVSQRAPNQKPDWNKAVSEAEKVVGYPTSFLSLRWLLSDEIANIAVHLRKLIGSSHPLLKTAKSLMYSGKDSMQAWGLIVLLVSKAAGHRNVDEMEQDKAAGVLHSQRALAEVTEMVRTAHLVHKGLVNLSPEEQQMDASETKDMLFGNKIALLGGDYLLSNAVQELAALRNQELVELVALSLRDLTESEFVFRRDQQNMPLPFHPKGRSAKEDWTHFNELASGSLLGKSCQGTLKLAGHNTALQEEGYKFGKHLALAWQASLDLEPFLPGKQYVEGATFSLVAAPVLFHLEHDSKLYDLIEAGAESVQDADYVQIHRIVSAGPGVDMTKKLCQEHARKAMEVLDLFEKSDARTALTNIIVAMGEL